MASHRFRTEQAFFNLPHGRSSPYNWILRRHRLRSLTTAIVLSNKPLVEAMFELRWGLDGAPGVGVDPHYQLLIGLLAAAIKCDFPVVERLPIADVPENLAPYAPHYRFRAGQDRWPLIQLGPGLLTVNDTEGYVWDEFFPLCAKVLDALFSVYPNASDNLNIYECTLRYIDADALNGDTAMAFLKKLHISIDVPESLFSDGRISGNTLGMGLSLAYPSIEPKGLFQVNFSQGRKNDQEALIWETQVLSRGTDAPRDTGALKAWIEAAHESMHHWFFRQIDGELLEKYR